MSKLELIALILAGLATGIAAAVTLAFVNEITKPDTQNRPMQSSMHQPESCKYGRKKSNEQAVCSSYEQFERGYSLGLGTRNPQITEHSLKLQGYYEVIE